MTSSTSKLRAEICKRADGACEHCGRWVGLYGEWGELDHFHSRRVEESLETCWLLCGTAYIPDGCHFKKTNSKPDAAYWLCAFIRHCGRYGYSTERAEARLQSLQVKHLTEVRQ